MPPDPPSKERLRRSLVRIINWSHPPVKNPGYGPVEQQHFIIVLFAVYLLSVLKNIFIN